MDIADLIVNEISGKEDSGFEAIRGRMNSKKALSKQEFGALISLLEKDPIGVLDTKNPTNKEIEMISKAIKRCKIPDPDRLVAYLTAENSKRSPVLLHSLLSKGCKMDTAPVVEYIHNTISSKRIFLCHLKLILAISRAYPQSITPAIVSFCKGHKHGISSEIVKKHHLETE